MLYPTSLNKLINSFEHMPGVGEKSAERFALAIIDKDLSEVEEFSKNLVEAKKNIKYCKICGHITDDDICSICSDQTRDKKLICVVEDYKSVIKFENAKSFKGTYHILGNLISPINGIYPDDINLSSLIKRVHEMNDEVELILAFKPSIEGETTTLYIKEKFTNTPVKVTRLSYGIPMGVELDYLDSLTIDKALSDRKSV